MSEWPEQRAFFERAPWLVAPELLGWRLIHDSVELVVVETEAYAASEDAASHAFPGRTRRNASMFGPCGHAYVYRSYGVHWCFNVVAHAPDEAGAVLIRAGEVVAGNELAQARRGAVRGLANGPGKLGQALGITDRHDGVDLAGGALRLVAPEGPTGRSANGPRVGISKAIDLGWRFWLEDSVHVSKGRPGPAGRRRRPG